MAHIKADNPKEQEYFDYLEDLRQSGATNMFGAAVYLEREFPELADKPRRGFHSSKKASAVLVKWMKFHDDPKRVLPDGH